MELVHVLARGWTPFVVSDHEPHFGVVEADACPVREAQGYVAHDRFDVVGVILDDSWQHVSPFPTIIHGGNLNVKSMDGLSLVD